MAKAPPKRPRTKLLEIPAGDALRGPETEPSRQTPLFRDPMPDRVEHLPGDAYAQGAGRPALGVRDQVGRLPAPRPCRARRRPDHHAGRPRLDARFPAIAAAAAGLVAGMAILDGEAVVLDQQGRSDHPALLRVLGGPGGKWVAPEAAFYAFDLL